MRVAALDIGGANIKASDGHERSLSRPFALWKRPDQLSCELSDMLVHFGPRDRVAVTMTGELADCYSTKAEGVDQILAAVERAAPAQEIRVWQTGGEFVTPQEARDLVPLVAAANWHALATWGARLVPSGSGLLIDVGSTTTDIIPLADGLAAPEGRTDPERLRSGELLYRGVRRTPLCAVARSIPFCGADWPLAAELFATTGDVWLLTEDLEEDSADRHTANGRPAMRADAADRLARQFCSDRDELGSADIGVLAQALGVTLLGELALAIERVAETVVNEMQCIVTAGEGEFLIRRAIRQNPGLQQVPQISLDALLGPQHSRSACAYALARLSAEHFAENA